MKSHSNDTLLKVDQVAKLLNVSVSAVYKWTQAGEFPAPYKLGDKKRSSSRWSEIEMADHGAMHRSGLHDVWEAHEERLNAVRDQRAEEKAAAAAASWASYASSSML